MKQNDNQDAEKQLEMQECATGARCQIWNFWKLFSGPAGENRRYQRPVHVVSEILSCLRRPSYELPASNIPIERGVLFQYAL